MSFSMRSIEKFWNFENIENAFLTIAGLFGCLFIFVTPPFQVADEYLHFYRAFQISEGQWIAQQQAGDCYGYSRYFEKEICLGGRLPRSLLTTVRGSSQDDLRFHPERKQDIRDIFAGLNLPLNNSDRIFIKFNTTGLHAPIPYIPQAVGIAIGKSLHLSPLLIFYFGRFSNFIVWLILAWIALKTTPIGKLVFLLLLLTPMSLFQASSLSADALTNGLAFLWMAIVFKLSLDRQTSMQPKHTIGLLGFSMLLCLSKIAYFPLLFLFFIIPYKKLKTRVRYAIMMASIAIASFSVILIWSSVVDRIYVPLSVGILPDRQIEFVLDRPLEFAATFGRTFVREGINYLHQFIGVLGWIDTPLPGFFVLSYWTVLIFVSLFVQFGNSSTTISFKQKIIISIVLALNIVVLSSLAYLWNPIGSQSIGGIQGRYFIPISPLFFMLLVNRKFEFDRRILQKIIVLYLLFSCILTLTILIHRYYI
ncbi:MAG: DUF2142 domain-containing protein [Geitlerinemataceae cyanobacterium]